MKLKKLLLATLFITSSSLSFATHIIGGSLTYEHLGGATYRITLKLYRDCDPAVTGQFDNNITVVVLQPNGSPFSPSKDISIPLGEIIQLDPQVDTCAFNPGLCVEEAIYTKIVNNLPPGTGGYHLFFQRCCRNNNIDNIINPLNSGFSIYTKIPDNMDFLTNSSPDWINFPPVFVCQGQDINFNHAATDKDGDSLYYKMYTPYLACDDNNPVYPCGGLHYPTFPSNTAAFDPVNYQGGFNANNPLGGAGLTIDGNGILSGIPPTQGYFVVGVMCEEYRDGQLINYIIRDFQYIVVNCPPIPEPGIGPVTGCAGLSINFTNTSTPLTGNSFYWDFGDPSSTTDNSTATHPSYSYPSIGSYAVMLVAQAGTPCADTIYDTLIVSGVTPDFTYTDSVCVNTPANFNDTSVPTANTTVTKWLWKFGDGGTAVTPTPTHTYTSPGTYMVKLIAGTATGCFDSITKNIYVQALPQAIATDTFACVSNPVTNLNGSVVGATGGIWSGNGTFSNINNLNAAYTPDSAELVNGYATLILSTTGNGFCPSTSDTMIINYSTGITANAGNDISVCKDIDSIQMTGTIITASGGQWVTSGNGLFYPNPFDLNAIYVPDPLDTAAGTVDIYLNSIGNGNCAPDSDTITITFTSIPAVAILSHDTACSGSVLVPVSASSTTSSGYWRTLGNGFFTPSDSLNSTNYSADSLDNFNGSVKLIYTSTNNGGCQSYSDTLEVYLIPAPNINFNFTSVCPKDTIGFNDLSTSIDPIVSWQWDFGDGDTDSIQSPSHVFDSSGTYNVNLIITSSNGCTNTLTRPVLVYAIPVANFYTDRVCEGMDGFFIDSSTVQGSTITSWNWDFNDGGTDSIQNPTYVYVNSGTYNVKLIVQSAQGCSDTITKVIPVQPPPTANFNSTPFSAKVGEPFSFTDLSLPNIVDWQWDFGDSLGTSTEQHPNYSYDVRGNYIVCLTVTDNMTCVDSACQIVIVFLPPLVPNAFSPDGTGANNVFYVLGGPYKELIFKIYNNWGEVIFESHEQAHGWDGKRDGVDQPVGVYVYTVEATTLDDVQHTIKGDVTLLR